MVLAQVRTRCQAHDFDKVSPALDFEGPAVKPHAPCSARLALRSQRKRAGRLVPGPSPHQLAVERTQKPAAGYLKAILHLVKNGDLGPGLALQARLPEVEKACQRLEEASEIDASCHSKLVRRAIGIQLQKSGFAA